MTKKPGRKGDSLEVDGDFFTPSESIARPQSGKEAFRSGSSTARDSGSPRLLVVEDDIDQRSIIEMLLKSADYDVDVASDGREALEKISVEIPDLIISDLMMPNIDGASMVKTLKEDKRYRDIPILILTVLGDAEKEYQLLSLGVDDYCEKSVQRKILLKRIENLLTRCKKANA